MLKVGILGTGHMAHKMAATIQQMRFSAYSDIILYAVASREKEKAVKFASQFDILRAYGSYEAMLQDSEIDLVYITSPLSCHYQHAKMCLQNGKNILCEKPMTVNQAQAKELFALAGERHLFAAEAMWIRYMPMQKIIRDAVASGKAGRPVLFSASICYSVSHKERLMDFNLAGGALLEVGVYPLHFSDIIFGESQVQAVFAEQNDSGLDMREVFLLRHKDGQFSVLSSGITFTSDRAGRIGCEDGYYLVDNINHPLRLEYFNCRHELVEVFHAPPQITGLEYEMIEAAEAIKDQRIEPVSMPHRDTVRMLGILDIIREKIGLKYLCEK